MCQRDAGHALTEQPTARLKSLQDLNLQVSSYKRNFLCTISHIVTPRPQCPGSMAGVGKRGYDMEGGMAGRSAAALSAARQPLLPSYTPPPNLVGGGEANLYIPDCCNLLQRGLP